MVENKKGNKYPRKDKIFSVYEKAIEWGLMQYDKGIILQHAPVVIMLNALKFQEKLLFFTFIISWFLF